MAEEEDVLVGFLGAEIDAALGRAWLHGPLVSADDWNGVAGELLAETVAGVIPVGISDLELAGDIANVRLAEFAARHHFTRGAANHVLEVKRSEIESWEHDDRGITPPTETWSTFETLHDELFPNTYYAGSQLLEQAEAGEAVLLGLVEHDVLVGYAVARIDSSGDGYLDFVGVADAARGRGHGRRLVGAVCRALLREATVSKVRLTVVENNAAALALYDRLGFRTAARIVGYRRQRS